MTEAGARACALMQLFVLRLEKTGCVVIKNNYNIARLPVTVDRLILNRRGYWKALLFALMLMPMSALALTPPGTNIDNTAAASFDITAVPATVNSNTVTVTSTIINTPSTITLYQYDPVGPGNISEEVPTQHATSGPPGAGFVVSPDPVVPGIGVAPTTLDPTMPIALNPVVTYHTGEPVFIEVTDLDQNLNPAVQETIFVTVTSSTGDQEELVLTETDLDTGRFIGYVQSTGATVTQYDGVLTLGADTTVDVNYVDQYDGSDTSAASTLIDPFGIVFNSVTGVEIDGITVAIMDSTGNPATVFGDDGISTYPNVVTTGGSATDSNGVVYNFPAGSYRFPLLAPGDYQLVVTVPSSLSAPSQRTITELQALPSAPFTLDTDASFGNVFTLQAGPPLHVDIPVDPLASFLVLDKSASKETAAVGDFIQYTLDLENIDAVAISANTEITDQLPAGFRYQANSVRVNNAVVSEPDISSDGRTLQFNVGTLLPGDSVEVKYVTEVSSSVRPGKAINTAVAVDLNALSVTSNEAQASVNIVEDLFASHSFIVGRVINGDCSADEHELPGFENARIYMEDGTYVVTDENGLYHFEGVTPGVHVVQLDKETIPDNLEIVACEENTRFAGTAYSQFVDIKGGSMWRANFYVRHKDPIKDEATLSLESELNVEEVKYSIEMMGGKVPVKNYRLMVFLPGDVDYIPGSSVIDGNEIDEPEVNDHVLVYRLGDLGAEWQKALHLRARMKFKADGELVTKAMFMTDTDFMRGVRSATVENIIDVRREKVENRDMVYKAHFEPMGVELTEKSKKELRLTIGELSKADVKLNQVIGHTDSRRVKERSSWLFDDNDSLSLARAKAVSEFLITELDVDANKVRLEGRGEREPIASNKTVEGRAKNRRADLFITTTEIVDAGSVKLTKPRSEIERVEVEGQPVYELKKPFNPVIGVEKLDISMFDEYWIKDAMPGTEWLMPTEEYLPEIPAVSIAVKFNPANKYKLLLDGEPVDPLFNFGAIRNKQSTVARVYWQGIHLKEGENNFEFIEIDAQGSVVTRIERTIVYSGVPVRAELVKEYSRLVADGAHSPVIALRFYDEEGRIAHPGMIGEYEVNAPYISKQEIDALSEDRLTGLDRVKPKFRIGREGVALLELEPTTETGRVIVDLSLSGNEDKKVEAWLQPEMRDWILVGLAEGTVGYSSVSGNMVGLGEAGFEEDYYDDGRIAFFAKGRVKGEWLLTTSYDSDKGEYDTDNKVHQLIDPDTYYTIYGDGTAQRYDASSAEKLYVKIEREQFYALYGDYETNMNVTELSKYNRRMTGVKSEMDTGSFSYNVFAAENINNFIKNEIRGDGTSGLYRLTGKDLVINSETIVIETRDRFRSEVIVESKTLRRHLDYNIDYQDGTIYFREPIPSRDLNFNPVYIVADYEVESPVKGDITAGGRAAVKLMDEKLEIGASVVHDTTFGAESDLVGADVKLDINNETSARVEVAGTDGQSGGVDVSGRAYLAEVEHEGKELRTRAYVKQQDAEFGLGQQSGGQAGTRKYGAEGQYKVNERITVDALAYHEDNLNTDANRDVGEASVIYNKDKYMLSAGARMARDKDGLGQTRDSDLLLLGASTRLFENKLNLRVNSETALSSSDDSSDYPSRYIVGADYALTQKVTVFAENEWTFGEDQDTEMARAGVSATPWEGAALDTSVNREFQENGERMFATLGMTQAFRMSEHWTGDIALDKSKTVRDPGATPFNVNVPIAQGTTNDDFTAVSAGTTYRAETYTINNRIETRNAQTEHKVGVLAGWERKLIEGVGYAAGIQLFDADRSDGSSAFDGDVRFSIGYRPVKSNWITLNRLDYKFEKEISLLGSKTRQRKLIDNFVTNYKPDHVNQLSVNYGIKYVIDSFDGAEYDGVTHLLGSEYRHDITRVMDFGLHAHTLYTTNSDNYIYSTGASIGFNLARNVWLSFGYNFNGFEDDDFSAAGYTAHGPYVQFRMKFDQDTASEIGNWLK